ncbi:MAG: hypothetical protein MHPSP_003656, partial [Paramarteilia canceri]
IPVIVDFFTNSFNLENTKAILEDQKSLKSIIKCFDGYMAKKKIETLKQHEELVTGLYSLVNKANIFLSDIYTNLDKEMEYK